MAKACTATNRVSRAGGGALLLRLQALKHLTHPLVNQIDRLQRPDHHLELDDLARRIPLDQVHAVDEHAVDRGLELQHRIVLTGELADVTKAVVEKHLERRVQIRARQRFAALGRVDYG